MERQAAQALMELSVLKVHLDPQALTVQLVQLAQPAPQEAPGQ